MHWRNIFLWVLTCHNLFKWLRLLRQFLSPPRVFAANNTLHTMLATTVAASLLVIPATLWVLDTIGYSWFTRGNLKLLGQSVFSYDGLLNKLQMCKKQKGSFIFLGCFFFLPLNLAWRKREEKKKPPVQMHLLLVLLSPGLKARNWGKRGKDGWPRNYQLFRIWFFLVRYEVATVIGTFWKFQATCVHFHWPCWKCLWKYWWFQSIYLRHRNLSEIDPIIELI